jgi:hypothetical protein
MSTTMATTALAPLRGALDQVWPGHAGPMPAAALAAAALAGAGAAWLLPTAPPGVGLFAVGLLVAAAALPAARGRVGAHEVANGGLAALLLTVVLWRDAGWLVALCLLGTVGAASYALSGGRTVVGVLLAGVSLPLAGLRALPWIGRGLGAAVPADLRSWAPRLRAAVASAGLLVVFGALFASADAAFAALLPSVDLRSLPVRAFLFAVFAGLALAAAFLAAAPPSWDVLAPRAARRVRPVEWIAPVGALVALFATFVGVQLTVLFGGDDHVLRTSGLTYAEYARSGFGQLVAVTVLTLLVVSAAARWAPRETGGQRLVLRVLLGALCALALVVVASALHRLHLYEEAFGFTRLRLFMTAFESWLGLLVVLVLLAGVRLRAGWLARAVVGSAGLVLLSLAALNPDGFVAGRNIDRFLLTGSLDVAYLGALSADAVPAIDRLPEPYRSCALAGVQVADGGAAGWNAARERARSVLEERPVVTPSACPDATGPAGPAG